MNCDTPIRVAVCGRIGRTFSSHYCRARDELLSKPLVGIKGIMRGSLISIQSRMIENSECEMRNPTNPRIPTVISWNFNNGREAPSFFRLRAAGSTLTGRTGRRWWSVNADQTFRLAEKLCLLCDSTRRVYHMVTKYTCYGTRIVKVVP